MLTGGCGRPHPPFFFLGTPSRSRAAWLLAACLLAGSSASASPPTEDLAAKAQRGKEAMAAGRFDQAAAVYAEIVQLLPSEPGMLLNLGMALSMAGRPRDAIPHLQAALKLRPELIPASLFLGSAYAELGQASRAVEPLQKVVAAQPDNREARQMLADALLSLQRYEPATRHFRRLSELAPREPRAWYGLGRSYEGLAREAFEGLQRSAPDSPYLLLLVAEAMAAQGKGANAFRLYREALEKRPGLPEAHEAVARIYEQTGQPEWAAREGRSRGGFLRSTADPRASSATSARAGTRPSWPPRPRPRARRGDTGSPAPPASWPARRLPVSATCLRRRRLCSCGSRSSAPGGNPPES